MNLRNRFSVKLVGLFAIIVLLAQSCTETDLSPAVPVVSEQPNLTSIRNQPDTTTLINSTVERDPDVVMDFLTEYPLLMSIYKINASSVPYLAYTIFQQTATNQGIILWQDEFGSNTGAFSINPDTGEASVTANTQGIITFNLKLQHYNSYSSLMASNVQGANYISNIHHNLVTPVSVPNSIWGEPAVHTPGETFDNFEFDNVGRVVWKPYGTLGAPHRWKYGRYNVSSSKPHLINVTLENGFKLLLCQYQYSYNLESVKLIKVDTYHDAGGGFSGGVFLGHVEE